MLFLSLFRLRSLSLFAEKPGLGFEISESLIGNMFGRVLESDSRRLISGGNAPTPNSIASFGVELAMADARHALNCAKASRTRWQVSDVTLWIMETERDAGRETAG